MTHRLLPLVVSKLAAATLAAGLGAALAPPSVAAADDTLATAPPGELEDVGPADIAAARIKYLHDRLRITPAQEPAWAKVAEVIRDNARAEAPLLKERVRSGEHGSATDNLGAYEKLGEAQLDGLKKFVAAFRTLYGGLSAEQRKIADSLFRLGPLSMVGAIPQLAEDLIPAEPEALASSEAAPSPEDYYPSYLYPAYPAYAYPYYPSWVWGAPAGLGASFFLVRRFHPFIAHRPHPFVPLARPVMPQAGTSVRHR